MREALSEAAFLRHGRYGHQLACDETVSGVIRRSIEDGSYEWPGGLRLVDLVRDGDRVLELGGGLGCLAALVCARRNVDSYCIIEANERLLPLIRRTLEMNGVTNAQAHQVALTDDAQALERGYVEFHLHEDFWASSTRRVQGSTSSVRVTARSLSGWIAQFRPDVIHCDIEGAEDGYFEASDLAGVRALSIEVHHDVVPAQTELRLRADLAAKGFGCPDARPVGGVLVFER